MRCLLVTAAHESWRGAQGMRVKRFYEGVVDGTVLAIPPAYFEITSGTARWLYRVMRRHAGRQTGGWAFSFQTLHAKSGSSQRFSDFARDLRRIAAASLKTTRHIGSACKVLRISSCAGGSLSPRLLR